MRKPRKPIPRVSKRRSFAHRQYPRVKKVFLDAHALCFKCGQYVPREYREVHHFFGKVGALLNYVEGFRMVSRKCHNEIESSRKESIANGWRANERLWNRPSLVIAYMNTQE